MEGSGGLGGLPAGTSPAHRAARRCDCPRPYLWSITPSAGAAPPGAAAAPVEGGTHVELQVPAPHLRFAGAPPLRRVGCGERAGGLRGGAAPGLWLCAL